MPEITVCIPAFKAADFIHHTLQSVQDQIFSDFKVEVAIEPADDTTEIACQPFRNDPRFNVVVNKSVLGWAGNVRGLLGRVDTPFFTVLPHDDLMNREYLSSLKAAIDCEPHAVVAYADMQMFAGMAGRIRLQLDGRDTASRLLSYHLGGADPVHWRGLTRSDALARGKQFPDNEFGGFACEFEWAQWLLILGEARRVPMPLYYKRTGLKRKNSVAREWRFGFSRQKLTNAAELHRSKIMEQIAETRLDEQARRMIRAACELSLLQWFVRFSRARFGLTREQRARINAVAADIGSFDQTIGNQLLARLHMIQCRIALADGNDIAAQDHARTAIRLDADYDEPYVHLFDLLVKIDALDEAVRMAAAVADLAPGSPSANRLFRQSTKLLNDRFDFEPAEPELP